MCEISHYDQYVVPRLCYRNSIKYLTLMIILVILVVTLIGDHHVRQN